MSDDIHVRGGASDEELAAVLALVRRPRAPAPDTFTLWRATRLAAIRRDQPGQR